MKKLKIFIIIILFVLLLNSCTQNTSNENSLIKNSSLNPNKPVSITLWHYYSDKNKQSIEELTQKFNETIGLEKGVVVIPVAKGNISDIEDEITKSANGVINSDEMPDIFSSYPDKAVEISKLGKLVDLNKYFSEEDKKKYVPSFLENGIFENGEIFIVPIVKSTEILYLNDSNWEEFTKAYEYTYDDLKTWEGIIKVSKDYYTYTDNKTPDIPWDGKAFSGFDSLANFIIIGSKQLGTEIIDINSKGAILDKQILRNIYDIYNNTMTLGHFYASGKFRTDNIKSQDLISYIGSSSGAVYFPTWVVDDNEQRDISFKALPYPKFKDGDYYTVQQGAGMCVSKSTPEKEEGAALFLKWFTDKEQNLEFALNSGYLPVNFNIYNTDELKEGLANKKTGDIVESNVRQVYDIASDQILDSKTYAAKPFSGSFDIRKILETTLLETTENSMSEAMILKKQGLSEEEILLELNLDKRFDDWIISIKKELDKKEIPYTEK